MASSSTSSLPKCFTYDVFLSFRGEDTRKNFIDHLYHALQHKSIHTYKDDERIKKGKRINDELIGSIEASRFYIIVFSKNYVSSSWCLDELVKIMECLRTKEHTAYPVFYDVEPSEIRKQSGAVKDAFSKHEKEESAGKWREALKEAADLAGWELKNTADGHEAKFIRTIVEEISLELRSMSFNIDENLVGMEARIKDVLSSLGSVDDDVRMIGIKGMGGGGKTTLARALFDQIAFQFEGKSFVENIREVSNASSSGLKSLQNQVLSDVLKDKIISISSFYEGKHMIKKMMSTKKVLFVLDDVDHIDQLQALAGEPNWFKSGSIIIITTRDEQVLVAHRIKLIYDVNLLTDDESICLFDRYAFGREIPIQGYKELSKQVVRYAAGLPLTIRVLGSFLCGKNEPEWVDAIERLKTIPLTETLKKLELSFTGLDEDYKEIFLDIACILKGWNKDAAIEALESCGFHARNGLRVLEQKSLVTISYDERVGMHDHIEEMGRNIVRRLHPYKPHKHSRLWISDEIDDILANDLGTKATKCLEFHTIKSDQHILLRGLKKMKELRYLSANLKECSSNLEYGIVSPEFPNALRFLKFPSYPFRRLPTTFQANNLVALKMANSKIEQLWDGEERKVLNKLRFLDLSYSKLRTLDLQLAPNLEYLDLKYCCCLEELHIVGACQKLTKLTVSHSKLRNLDLRLTPNVKELDLNECCRLVELCIPIGCLENLSYFNLSGCFRFKSFLFMIEDEHGDLVDSYLSAEYLEDCPFHPYSSLQKLQISCYYKKDRHLWTGNPEMLLSIDMCACKNLEMFLRSICGLRHVLDLNLKGSLVEVPKKIDQLEWLEILTLSFAKIKHLPDSICMLKNLTCLNLESFLLLEKLPEDIGRLECLKKLTLSSAKIKHLPDSICMLQRLQYLKLIFCWLLEKLPKDLGQLECLEKLTLSSAKIKHLPGSICKLKHLKFLKLDHCLLLEKLPEELGCVKHLRGLYIGGTSISYLPQSILLLEGLYIYGSRGLLESYGFTSEIETSLLATCCYVQVPEMQAPTEGVSSTVLHG